jgi:hypothetical protein
LLRGTTLHASQHKNFAITGTTKVGEAVQVTLKSQCRWEFTIVCHCARKHEDVCMCVHVCMCVGACARMYVQAHTFVRACVCAC